MIDTPFLRPSAYKARVGGLSPWCGIEQIHEGGISSSTHSQSEQYLIGERFVPPTIIIIIIVGSQFTAQVQVIQSLGPVSPLQWIYREWVEELSPKEWDNG